MVDSKRDLINHVIDKRSKISTNIDKLLSILHPFLNSDHPDIQEFKGDIHKINENALLLQKELKQFLDKEVLEKNSLLDSFDDYLAKVRHDLRNPINVIKGYTEIIIEDLQNRNLDSHVPPLQRNLDLIEEVLALIVEIKVSSVMSEHKKEIHSLEDKLTLIKSQEKKVETEEFHSFKERFSILIVDDVEENCQVLERYLNRLGYKNLRTATNGFLAVEEAKKCDLMLLDIDMPGMNGLEVLLKVKNDIIARKLMVIVVSAGDTLLNVIECIKLGAEDFLTKPFNHNLLQVRIDSSVEKAWFIHNDNLLRQRVEFERYRYQKFLDSIFPPTIVKELAATGRVETRYYENVAILFADVVNFTSYCDNHKLHEIDSSLQEFAAMCEVVASRNNLQKIKTIGDCFLGVSGMLLKSENSVLDCIRCGEELIKQTESLSSKWKVHIGINFGTVIGGIVGKSQYLFDVWGDAVNTASRVESISEFNAIYLSKFAWDQVSKTCLGKSLGEIPFKGKSPIEVFKFEGYREQLIHK